MPAIHRKHATRCRFALAVEPFALRGIFSDGQNPELLEILCPHTRIPFIPDGTDPLDLLIGSYVKDVNLPGR